MDILGVISAARDLDRQATDLQQSLIDAANEGGPEGSRLGQASNRLETVRRELEALEGDLASYHGARHVRDALGPRRPEPEDAEQPGA